MTYLEYLVSTATPGGTMARQGPDTALGRLNPSFAERLAAAIKAARAEGINASVFSAYRPPGYGVGGYADKFNSLHAYGLATDIAGIGRPGSGTAKRWYDIATANGLYNPYGPMNAKEWNHFQAVPEKGRQYLEAHPDLRASITASGPPDLDAMWAAAGIPVTKSPDPFGVMAYNASYTPKPTPAAKTGGSVLPGVVAALTPFLPGIGLPFMATPEPVPMPVATPKTGSMGGGVGDLLAQATAAAKAGNPFLPTGAPGPQGGGIVSGPSGTFKLNGDGTYSSLRTGRTFSLNPGRI